VVAVCVCPPSLRERVERAARKVGAARLTCSAVQAVVMPGCRLGWSQVQRHCMWAELRVWQARRPNCPAVCFGQHATSHTFVHASITAAL
jgi:hypothetical protein